MSQLQADSTQKGYRYPDEFDDKSLSFTQVFLRSSCLEELLACVVCNSALRLELGESWVFLKDTMSPDASPSSDRTHANSNLSVAQLAASALFQVLLRTMTTAEDGWFDIVSLLFAPHGRDETDVPTDTREEDIKIRQRANSSSADWVARCERAGFRSVELGLIRVMKREWYSEWLEMERRDLAVLVDLKKDELSTSLDNDLWTRVTLSGELVDLYEKIRDNLDTCTVRHVEESKSLVCAIDLRLTEFGSMRSTAEADQVKSVDRQAWIGNSATETEAEYKPKIESIILQRVSIDEKISELESRKRDLKLELEQVSARLVEAQCEQRINMETEDAVRAELNEARIKFERMLESEVHEAGESAKDWSVCERGISVVGNSRNQIVGSQSTDSAKLGEVYAQFDNAFVEAVQDHISVLCESIQEIYRRCKRVCDDLESTKKSKTAQSMSQVLGNGMTDFEREEFNASVERINLRLVQLESKLREESLHVTKFAETFTNFFTRYEAKLNVNRLLKGEVDKVNVVLGEAEKLLTKYRPQKTPEAVATTVFEEEIGEPQPDN